MNHHMPPGSKDYLPPPKPMSPARRALGLRVMSAFAVIYLLGGIWYLSAAMPLWQATLIVVPLAGVFTLVIIGLSKGMDTLTRWLGYLTAGVTFAALVVGYATGK